MTTTKPKTLNTGLVAVPNLSGGFNIFLTGGQFEPRTWLHGRLYGSGWFASKADLEWAAERDGRRLVKFRDYYQLAATAEG